MVKLKHKTVEQNRFHEDNPVGFLWAVQWVGEDLWWEGFVPCEFSTRQANVLILLHYFL